MYTNLLQNVEQLLNTDQKKKFNKRTPSINFRRATEEILNYRLPQMHGFQKLCMAKTVLFVNLQEEICLSMGLSEDEESDFVIRFVRFYLHYRLKITSNGNNNISSDFF